MTKTATQFKAYSGRNIDQMPLMLREGVVPLPVVGFMQNRDEIIRQFGDIYADTSDLVAYGDKKSSDEIKMILTVDNQGRITGNGRKALELINPTQERNSGAIMLGDTLYDGFNGSNVISLSRKDLEKYGINRNLTEAEVLNHPGWRVLLRHPRAVPAEFAYDKGLMQEVINRTFAEMKKRHDYRSMEFYLDASEKHSKLRAWAVGGLDNRSYAIGRIITVNDYGRFVGIAPEAPNAPVEAESELFQTVKPYTPTDLQAFDNAMKGLEEIVRPDVLKPFANLRKKL